MNQKYFTAAMAVFLAFSLFTDCSKKVVKAVLPAVVETKSAVKPPPAPDKDSFRESAPAPAMKDALVPIYFEFDKYDILPSEIPKLEHIASLLIKSNNTRLLCEGHCDERGTQDYNMGLGENRARAVKKWLTAYGINDLNLETTSYGKEQPAIANCAAESCHTKNRRAEWKVLQ
jgi:peptidoglycan-associated lipoprotein